MDELKLQSFKRQEQKVKFSRNKFSSTKCNRKLLGRGNGEEELKSRGFSIESKGGQEETNMKKREE
jgi:hypothetical protein